MIPVGKTHNGKMEKHPKAKKKMFSFFVEILGCQRPMPSSRFHFQKSKPHNIILFTLEKLKNFINLLLRVYSGQI